MMFKSENPTMRPDAARAGAPAALPRCRPARSTCRDAEALHDEARCRARLAELDALIAACAQPRWTEAEYVELFDRGRAPRCTCSSMCTATRATAARP
jgi:hypothetical protein